MIELTFVKDIVGDNCQVRHAALYKLSEPVEHGYRRDWDDEDPPLPKTDHVVISAADVMYSGIETYIFASDGEGEITDWGEMEGSMKGTTSHLKVIEYAGWSLVG